MDRLPVEEVHHQEVLLEEVEDLLLGVGHQEVRQGVHRGDLESQALLEDRHREVHLVHRLDQAPQQVLRPEYHQGLTQEAHLAHQAEGRPLEDHLVVGPAALLQGQSHPEVAQPALQHHLPEHHQPPKAHLCRPWLLLELLPPPNSAVWA